MKSIIRKGDLRKKDLFNVIFKSVVLYGCEIWQLKKRIENNFLSFSNISMNFRRRSADISRIGRVRNDRIREIMDTKNNNFRRYLARTTTQVGARTENARRKNAEADAKLAYHRIDVKEASQKFHG